jgi:hypothetical protein
VENLLNVRREKPRVWTNRSIKLYYEQPWYRVSLQPLEITTHFSSLPTGNNNHKK